MASKTSIGRSVVANWAGEGITVISGLVLPRLIDNSLSSAHLGVWDLSWSMRSLLAISMLGVGSSTAHFVSKFNASDDNAGRNRMLSATLALICYVALIVVIATTVMVAYTPQLLGPDSAELVGVAKFMIISMGGATVLQFITTVYGGVLVGGHRFDLLNGIEISSLFLMLLVMAGSLLAGWGLVALGLCVFAQQVIELVIKWWCAYRIQPSLRIRPRWSDWQSFRELAVYGLKTAIDGISTIVMHQSVIMILLAQHGPVAVAMYSRPRALFRIANRFLMGYGRVLVPATGEIIGKATPAELAEILIQSSRNTLYLAMPIVVPLLVLGDLVLRVWMGEAYSQNHALLILMAATVPFLWQRGTWHVLLGAGAHGKVALATAASAVVTLIAGPFLIGRFGVEGCALAVALPLGIVNLVVFPWVACRLAKLSIVRYLGSSLPGPLAQGIILAAVLLVERELLYDWPWAAVLVGAALSGTMLLRSALGILGLQKVRAKLPNWLRTLLVPRAPAAG